MKVRDAKLALAIGMGLLLSAPLAHADNNSVAITATGTVSRACTVSLNGGGASETYSLGDLTQSGTGVQIGTVTETCNDNGGYSVAVASANDGTLKGGTTGATIAYTLAYGSNTNVNLSSGSATVTTATTPTGSTPPTNAVKLSWTGSPTLTADTYSDTLTFTMAAK